MLARDCDKFQLEFLHLTHTTKVRHNCQHIQEVKLLIFVYSLILRLHCLICKDVFWWKATASSLTARIIISSFNWNNFCYIPRQASTILKKKQMFWKHFGLKNGYRKRKWKHYLKICIFLLRNSVSLRTTDFKRCLEILNPLNPELNPICYLLALLGAHHFLHFSRIRVKSLTLRLLMSYIYGAPILDVSRSYTTTQHSR